MRGCGLGGRRPHSGSYRLFGALSRALPGGLDLLFFTERIAYQRGGLGTDTGNSCHKFDLSILLLKKMVKSERRIKEELVKERSCTEKLFVHTRTH